ncbi:MAG: TRAP transporter permease, partial [Desulfonatronovibrio sp.]
MQKDSQKSDNHQDILKDQRTQSTKEAAEDIVMMTEAGARDPKNFLVKSLIVLLCLAWSLYQLVIAYDPINSHLARAWHLAFAICLAFLAYPAYKQQSPPIWVNWTNKVMPYLTRKSNRRYIPFYDVIFAILSTSSCLYIWWEYDNLIYRQGLPNTLDIVMGVI